MVKDGKPVELTSHTLNPVPCAIGGPGLPPGLHFRWLGGGWWRVVGWEGLRLARLAPVPSQCAATQSACAAAAAAAGRTCRGLGWPTVQPPSSTCSASRWGGGS